MCRERQFLLRPDLFIQEEETEDQLIVLFFRGRIDDMDSTEAKLWRLEVASAKDPELWSEERADEAEPVEVKSRQLDGIGTGEMKRSQS